VRRGEKVTVEVNVVVEGEAAYGTLTTQDANTITIEADVQSSPTTITIRLRAPRSARSSRRPRSRCPRESRWCSDPEMLVVNVVAAPTAEDLESEGAGEAAEEAEGEGEEAAEGEGEAGEEAPAEASE